MLSLSAIIALSVLSLTSAYYIVNNQREHSLYNLTQLAKITGENVKASLMFDDEESASKILQPKFSKRCNGMTPHGKRNIDRINKKQRPRESKHGLRNKTEDPSHGNVWP